MTFDIDPSQVLALAVDLDKAAHRAIPEIRQAVEEASARLEKGWKANATVTAGKHGKRYPAAITHDVTYGFGSIEGEVGPDSSKPQGGMSFEYGSVKQPPHLDGMQAAEDEEPRFQRSIVEAAAKVLDL